MSDIDYDAPLHDWEKPFAKWDFSPMFPLNVEFQVLKIKRLDKDLPMPDYQTDGAAGIDLYCTEDIIIRPNSNEKISFGIAIELPYMHFGMVTTRSGIGFKLSTESRLGIIDFDYRGELKGKFYNYSNHNEARFKKGDRIAQLIVIPYAKCMIVEKEELGETERGTGGFGHTGVR